MMPIFEVLISVRGLMKCGIVALMCLIFLSTSAFAGPGFRQGWFERNTSNADCLDASFNLLIERGWSNPQRSSAGVLGENDDFTIYVNCSTPGIVVFTMMMNFFPVPESDYLTFKAALRLRVP